MLGLTIGTKRRDGMHDLWTWYWAVEVLGIAALPTAGLALAHLPDRGWGLAKPLAILLVGVACWLPLVVFTALPFSRGWIVLVLLLFVAANAMLLMLRPRLARDLLAFVRRQWLYILCSEALFALTLWIMGSLRALNPQAEGTEKFMDQAFLSAIIRAPHLPPPDPWLSGYAINYYYFGHYLLGMLAKALGTAAPVAFNIGIALTAALAATGIFSVATNLTAVILKKRTPDDGTRDRAETTREDAAYLSTSRVIPRIFRGIPRSVPPPANLDVSLTRAVPFALFAVVAALVMGNLRSFWVWWAGMTATAQKAHQTTWAMAWNWLSHPALWTNYDYWTPSRAIPRTITEFPAFSFLLADLHAHVLALPYAVLAVGVALHLWLAPPRVGLGIFGAGRGRWVALLVAGLSIGALYLINGWDLPTYLALALVALALHQWNAHGRQFTAALWGGLARAVLPLLALCFIPYLPFYLHFVSPGQGIGYVPGTATHIAIPLSAGDNVVGMNLGTRTAIGDEIGANGVMIAIFASWLLVLLAREIMPMFQTARSWSLHGRDTARLDLPAASVDGEGPYTQAHMVRDEPPAPFSDDADAVLMEESELDTSAALPAVPLHDPSPGAAWLRAWGVVGMGALLLAALTWLTPLWDGWVLLWGLIFFVAALGLAIAPFARADAVPDDAAHARAFPLILIAFGAGLIALCEVVFLRDVFLGYGPRMNTIFKAYFQVWLLFALASAPALAWLLTHLPQRLPRGIFPAWQPVAAIWRGAWALVILGLIAVTLIFPLGASHVLYPLGQPNVPQSLNGLTDNTALDFGDIEAIQWMNAHIAGDPVIAEGIDPQNAEYSYTIGRVSVFTGLPTIIGWPEHEYQWRVNWLNDPAHAADYNARLGDLHTIYTSTNPQTVLNLLHHYHVQYLYVGAVEEQVYGASSDLSRFRGYMPVVYDTDGVVIYAVPQM
jgi:YYY domain-containing protein